MKPNLFRARACLRRDELLQVADGVVRVAFDTNFLAKAIVTNNFDHGADERAYSERLRQKALG